MRFRFLLLPALAVVSFLLIFNVYPVLIEDLYTLPLIPSYQVRNELSQRHQILVEKSSEADRELEYCYDLLNKSSHADFESYQPKPDLTSDADVIKVLDEGCPAFRTKYDYNKEESEAGETFSIAYSIVAHRNLHQLAMLMSAIYRTENLYCVHVDAKSNATFSKGVIKMAECFPNVFPTSKRERVIYASFSRLKADINCMRDLVNVPTTMYNWKFLINLCGQDFPISTHHEIIEQLKELKGKNSIPGTKELNQVANDRTKYVYRVQNVTEGNTTVEVDVQTQELHSPPPYNFTKVKNLAYNVFTRDFLKWALVDSKAASALLNWSSVTHTPDEHFWGMLQMYPGAPGGSQFFSWWGIARAIVWKGTKQEKNCHGYWRRQVCVFSGADLFWMTRVRHIFINKIDVTYDVTPIRCMRILLDEREKGKISEWNPAKKPLTPPDKLILT